MEKRAFIALLLSFVVLYAYMALNRPAASKMKGHSRPVQRAEPSPSLQKAPGTEIPVPSAFRSSQIPEEEKAEEEKTVVLRSELAEVTLSSIGALVKTCTLLEKGVIRDRPVHLVREFLPEAQPLAIDRIGEIQHAASRSYALVESSERTAVFEKVFNDTLLIRKRFKLDPEHYRLALEVTVQNLGEEPLRVYRGFDISMGFLRPLDLKAGARNLVVTTALDDPAKTTQRKKLSKIRSRLVEAAPVRWAGLNNLFFTLILDPLEPMQALIMDKKQDSAAEGKKPENCYFAALRSAEFILSGGEAHHFDYQYYLGPKDYKLLKSYGAGYEEIMNFHGFIGPITRILLVTLKWLYGLIGNYGAAIIILTIMIKVVFYPLTQKSFKSMKQMQALQPQLAELKEKYKDNPRKMQQETMAMYKKNKVNPLGGCFPMLLQIPIFFALFTMLKSSIELRGANFLWIKDLTLPDKLITIPGSPVDINILPLVMGATMLWQQKLSTVDPSQQKMMNFMPIMFTVLFYGLPSGLVLYWLTNNVLTIAQQYHIKRSG